MLQFSLIITHTNANFTKDLDHLSLREDLVKICSCETFGDNKKGTITTASNL